MLTKHDIRKEKVQILLLNRNDTSQVDIEKTYTSSFECKGSRGSTCF